MIRAWLLSLLIWIGPAHAADIALFRAPYEEVSHYDEIISDMITGKGRFVKPGDRLVMANGAAFTFRGVLGRGHTTLVVETSEGRALRIPLESGGYRFVHLFAQEMEAMDRSSLPHVKVLQTDHASYALVEKLNVKFTGEDFFREGNHQRPQNQAALKEFYEFMGKSWQFTHINDVKLANIAYTKQGWLVLDAGGNNSMWGFTKMWKTNSDEGGHILSLTHLPKEVAANINKVIARKRRSENFRSKCPAIFSRLFSLGLE